MNKTLVLNKIKDAYGFVTDADFARFLELKVQTFASWLSRGTYDIHLLYAKCIGINPEFLITGEGPVKRLNDVVTETTAVYSLKSDRLMSEQNIPLWNIEAAAGIVALFNSHNNQTNPEGYISIPGLPKCDGAVKVTGDSMYPLLKSGDIIMYKQINDVANDIFWGEMYVLGLEIHGDEHVLVKYIQKSDKDGYIKLVSQNKHHQDMDVKLSKIKALGLIKASVRINAMV